MADVISHFLILFASQTGNAQSIAEGLKEEAEEKGFHARVCCTNEFDKDKVSERAALNCNCVATPSPGPRSAPSGKWPPSIMNILT